MTRLMIAASLSLVVALFGTPVAIRFLRARGIGQLIREDGPKAHFAKKGTPTMGGVVIIGAALLGYAAAHIPRHRVSPFTDSGLLAVGVVVALGGLGFLDDYIKIRKRRSLGLSKRWKIFGQAAIAIIFALIAGKYTQAVRGFSFVRPLGINLGPLFVVWVFLVLAACSNGVNLADGLDGLACGSSAMVMGAYVVICFWQYRHACGLGKAAAVCYTAPHSLDLAIVAASLLGAAAGFLWWNAAPARIFMGDTGSLALGGAMAAMALLTNTQLLVIVLGGLFVIEVSSVILQVVSYRVFGRRALLMAPLHHHFELLGWPEFTVIVRFWILAGLFVAFGLGLFYADFIARGGVG
ncbi:MAG TPA: phospho-N-acetylmuramoyl-pentapeptide-transferase [Actinomycetota bacterium]|nr:phospho-N-acetylmuramoyl-pentapeptide-transferase [Actinomycetota bacterium]